MLYKTLKLLFTLTTKAYFRSITIHGKEDFLFSGVTGFSIFGGGIAHFAHVGGAIIGFIMMKYWEKNQFKRWN